MRSYTRPNCQTPGCYNEAAPTRYYNNGPTAWRKWCSFCHNKRTAERHGLTSIAQVVAKNAGFDSSSAYLNSTHPYRQHRKDYCENVDGRLGYKCTTTVVWDGQLDTDHINGNPRDNRPENLQTLCKCCHSYKTWKFGDAKTPGRKALNVTY